VEVATLRKRNKLVGNGAKLLALRNRGLNPLVQEQGGHQVPEHRAPVSRGAIQFAAVLSVSHGFNSTSEV
jgi:hypothetical protein